MREKCFFLFVLLFFAPCLFAEDEKSRESDSELYPLRIALQWLPQSQFAGYYIARDRGFYKDAGLDVTLVHTGPGPSSLDYLAANKADFATMFLADAIVQYRKPIPIVQVAQMLRRSNLMLVAWKDMGVEKPSDLDGKSVSCWPGAFSAAFLAFFRMHNIKPQLIPQHYTINLFLHRGVSACSAMSYNEFHRVYQAGVDDDKITVFMMRDYGLSFPEDGIYAPVETVRDRPDVCEALRRATIEGWKYVDENRDEAIDVVLRESRAYGVPANRPHMRWMLDRILESVFCSDENSRPGQLDVATYKSVVKTLKESGLIDEAPPFDVFAPLEKKSQ